VLTRSRLTYGVFFETFDFVASSTLSVAVAGVVGVAAVSLATESVALLDGCVVGWEGGEGGDASVG
jgi:hypothetical protein